MNPSPDNPMDREEADRQAAAWVLRHDRGLTPGEQDEFSQWLAANPSHGGQFARYRENWSRLDQLARWRPAHSGHPNPNLLAPRARHRARLLPFVFAAAAAIALAFVVWRGRVPATTSAPPTLARIEQRQLEDGSVIELNRGAIVSVDFVPGERHITLERGEAHFTVAKDPSRPFIVTAGGVKVRAVGTVFDVRLGAKTVEVLVTEGRVRVNHPIPVVGTEPARNAALAGVIPELTAGQHAVVSLGIESAPMKIDTVSEAEMARMLAWQPRRLDFNAAPLSEIVAEFNRRNSVQLVVAEPALGALRISTSFRSDNVYGFVRLLEVGFDVRAEYRDGTAIVLHKVR